MPRVPALFLVIVAVIGGSVYANLSHAVTDGWYFRFFPPFIPYHNLNLNHHLGAEYLNVGEALVAGDGFANPFREPTGPTAWMPPVLPGILASLLWICGGNKDAVMVVVILLQLSVLVGTGWLILTLARQSTRALGLRVAAAFFIIGMGLEFFLCFQFTHDVWLVLLVLDLLVAGLCWWRPLSSVGRSLGWGCLGGLIALINPIVAFTWVVVSVAVAVRQRAMARMVLAALVAGLVVAPWTIRNYLVLGRLIPVKSNAGYELYQSQCLSSDGLVQSTLFVHHPYSSNNAERLEYKRVGEVAYMDRKAELFLESLSAHPLEFARRVVARLVVATYWYVPFDRFEEVRIPGWVWLRRLAHPLPLFGLLILVLTSRQQPLQPAQWIVMGVYGVYLLPYIAISYYDRYSAPLLGAKVLLVVWGADRLLILWLQGARARKARTWIFGRRSRGEVPNYARLNGKHAAPANGTTNGNGCHAGIGLSIVIPVYNERQTLTEILRRVRAFPMEKQIIVVDDGSTDGTRDLLLSMQDEPDLCILYHPENRGKGAALRTGFAKVSGEIVIVQDADLEYDPAEYDRLIRPILDDQADVVYGSRFLSNGHPRASGFWHVLANRVLTTVSNLFTRLALTDMETGYKVFRRETIQALAPRLKQNRFGIEPELTAKAARGGYRIREVPIQYFPRTYKEGKKIGWRDGMQALWCFLRYWRWD